MSNFCLISDNGVGKVPEVGGVNHSPFKTSHYLRIAIRQDLAECGLSRDEVAVRLSDVSGRVTTVAQINAYVAETNANRFPAELIPAWVSVTKSRRMLDMLCAEVGLSVATSEDKDFAELGRAKLRVEQLEQRLRNKV